jgi:hypothetical protein
MAEQDNFIFKLGADITPFTKSITQVEAELKRVRNELKTKTGQAIVETNAYIQQLEQSLVDLKKVGFTSVAKGAQQGQTALFALGQVARDLPFGFIAIQNNLPLLVDQFVALKQSTGSAGKALGAILNSIAGPAGLAFGFGVLTSAITGLVQEYGSLSNALGQIFGLVSRTKIATEELDKAQIKSRASALGETQSINTLIGVLNNSKSTYADRLGAYNQLNNIIPDVLAGLDKEKTINGDNKKELEGLLKIKKENIILDGTRQALIKAIEKEAENAFTALAKAQKQDFFGNLGNALKGILKGFPPFLAAQLEAIDQANQSGVAYDFLSEKLGEVDKKLATNQGKIDANTEAYKRQQKAIEEAAKARAKAEGIAEKDNAKRFAAFIEGLKKQKEEQKKLRAEVFSDYAQGKPLQDVLDKLNKEKEARNKVLELEKKLYGFRADATEKFKDLTGPRIEETIFNVERMQAIADTYQKLVQQRFQNIAGIVQDTLTAPLTYLFDTVLEGGKISWKELGNIVVEQLKRIAIQITTTAAAVAIADLLTNGGYSASVKLFNKATSIVDRGGTGVNVGRPSAVNFGGIQGGLGLSGQVVFVQRGTDLVGVLNRSNATINRVG